jgi:N-acetylmuramoyl-L-alanine amidase
MCIGFMAFMLAKEEIFTIVIDPSDAPRQLATAFARGATLQCAQEIQKYFKSQQQVHIIITRTPGSHLSHENYAQMSNRFGARLYIHISFFQETEVKPRLYLYYHDYGDIILQNSKEPVWYTYESAHHASQKCIKKYADLLTTKLHMEMHAKYHIFPVLGIPCAPLIGILAPALMIEIGLLQADAWQSCVQPLCCALEAIIQYA